MAGNAAWWFAVKVGDTWTVVSVSETALASAGYPTDRDGASAYATATLLQSWEGPFRTESIARRYAERLNSGMIQPRDGQRSVSDQKMEELKRRFSAEYQQAAAEMRSKLDKFMADYEKENAKWRQQVQAGKATEAEYKDWRKMQAMNQSWMEGMVSELSADAARTDELCMAYINNEIPQVFADNANGAAFDIESHIGRDTHSFDLYDRDTVRRLIAEDSSLLPPIPEPKLNKAKDTAWNARKMRSAITQSVLQGESVPHAAERLMQVFKMDEAVATRTARTALTGAENAGRVHSYERAKAIGINLEQEWMATLDQRTRHSHRLLDGQHVPVGKPFKVEGIDINFPADPTAPAEYVYNCFVGDTLSVPLGGIERSFGRLYEGDAVTVRTSRGVEFTCTPNHPILTTQGWVPAGFLDDGYDLIVADIGNGLVLRDNPDIEHVGTRMDAIHELCSELASQGAARLDVNFHEDVLARDVDVITQERPLRVNAKTFELEPVDKLRLELTDALASSDGAKVKFLSASMTASDGFVSGSGESGPLRWASVSHALKHRLRTVAGSDSHAFEPAGYGTSTDAEVLRESLDGLSAVIEFDHVVDVDVHPVSCHVYNLQTESGAYLVTNNDSVPLFAISHNCRCTLVAWFPDIEQEDNERWDNLPKGMTYEDWKNGKLAEKADGVPIDGNPKTLAGVRRGKPMTFDEANELRGNPDYNMAERAGDRYYEANRKVNEYVNQHGYDDSGELQALRAERDEASRAYQTARREQNGYRINCQTCVVANEARRRGYNVEATPNNGSATSIHARLGRSTNLAWIDRATGRHPDYIRYEGAGQTDYRGRPIPTHRRFMQWLDSDGVVEQGARYTIEFWWKGRGAGGHIISLERTEQGLRMYDPQCGETYTGDAIGRYFERVKFKTTTSGTTYADGPELLKVSDYDFDTSICDQILREAR